MGTDHMGEEGETDAKAVISLSLGLASFVLGPAAPVSRRSSSDPSAATHRPLGRSLHWDDLARTGTLAGFFGVGFRRLRCLARIRARDAARWRARSAASSRKRPRRTPRSSRRRLRPASTRRRRARSPFADLLRREERQQRDSAQRMKKPIHIVARMPAWNVHASALQTRPVRGLTRATGAPSSTIKV